ncbi:hypothetical protein Areg01_44590 [Actinoplanes regularis]|nr:hypothetical protein Areg01_44590 [Actinoplanes regularis]
MLITSTRCRALPRTARGSPFGVAQRDVAAALDQVAVGLELFRGAGTVELAEGLRGGTPAVPTGVRQDSANRFGDGRGGVAAALRISRDVVRNVHGHTLVLPAERPTASPGTQGADGDAAIGFGRRPRPLTSDAVGAR